MSKLNKLKKITTLPEFARFLGYEPKMLSYILYKIPDDKKYYVFTINKKNGGKREIKTPNKKLKLLQKRLLELLQSCYEEITEKKKPLSHGFRKKYSISSNANKHIKKRHVFNIDLENFFPSFNFGRVRGYFISNKHFELKPTIATLIAQIACFENELPQGSPCSPIISNFVAHILDIKLVKLAHKYKCTYSRYADDITFSTNIKDFPKQIAYKNDVEKWVSGKTLENLITKNGFHINHAKTSMQLKMSRQSTTGLVVNQKVNIKKEYYRKARSMCNKLFATGDFYLTPEQKDSDQSPTINQLEGILSFIYHIKRPYDESSIGKRRNDPNAITKLYRKFLFYKHFYSNDMPLIVCEGKTDIIYLKCALEKLCNNYPSFIKTRKSSFEFKIRFLNLTKNLRDVLAISKGTPGLKSLMDIYKTNMNYFGKQDISNPVIILTDNDLGAEQIKKKLKIKNNKFEKTIYHFHKNLYIIPTKINIPEGEEHAIEDLFDNNVLSSEIDGKIFNRSATINTEKEYSKIVFAQKIIKAQKDSINFNAFKPIFDSFQEVINKYQNSN